MNGVNGNGVALAKNGHVYLTKKQGVPRSDDPEFLAECRYAKENGLDLPIVPEPVKPVEHNPRLLSQRNRSKSTSDVKSSPPPKAKNSKAERKARNRAVSGCWGKKDNRFEYGLNDYDEELEDYANGEFDDTVVDDDFEDDYTDVVFKFDIEKIRGCLAEYFNNPNTDCISELAEQSNTNDNVLRVTRELLTQSIDLDHCRVALGYRLMLDLLKNKVISEKAVCNAFEETLSDLDTLIQDAPRARENLTLFIAKSIHDKIVPRIVFDNITSKVDDNRVAVSCALEVYFYLNNVTLLRNKFDTSGGFEPLDVLDDQMERALQEFILSADAEEVAKRLTELQCQHYNHTLVYLIGYYAINKMNEQLMGKLAKLLKYLIDVDGCLLKSSLQPGFERLYKSLNELYIDLPAAYSLCELFVKKCQAEGFLDESIANACPKPSGKRARTLSQGDENGKIFVLDAPTIKNGV